MWVRGWAATQSCVQATHSQGHALVRTLGCEATRSSDQTSAWSWSQGHEAVQIDMTMGGSPLGSAVLLEHSSLQLHASGSMPLPSGTEPRHSISGCPPDYQWAEWNGSASQIWPAGLTFDTTGLGDQHNSESDDKMQQRNSTFYICVKV